jgi:hypothetical protein
MPRGGVFRNVNILKQIDESCGTEIIDIYQPGFLNPYDISNGLKYSGFITSLRLTIEVNSIAEMQQIASDVLADDVTIAENTKETFAFNPKKCITFFMRTSLQPTIKVADIFLFNQQPFYYLDLISYFTSAGTFDVAPDAVISCQCKDAGYGLLQGQDRVLILGSSVEESPDIEGYTLTVG